MKEIRCIKCGRALRDPESIARGMGPECAGDTGGRRRKNRSGVRSRSGFSFSAIDHGSAGTPTLFSLVGEYKQQAKQLVVEEVSPRKSGLAKILMQFPTDLVDLVLSAPAAGAITSHVKNYSKKKKKLEGSMPPGRTLQEIRHV